MNDFQEIWKEFEPNGTGRNSIISLIESKVNFWDWLRDTKHIDGVALTDKGQCSTRWDTWLYGWDCASIVIFNPLNVVLHSEVDYK